MLLVDAVTPPKSSALQRLDPSHPRDVETDTVAGPLEDERLLAGEREDTRDVAVAIHWSKVYADLFGFKDELRAVTESEVASMSLAARAEVERTNLKWFRGEARHLHRRLEFWERRAAVLLARAGDA
jgi:hypothetical protein